MPKLPEADMSSVHLELLEQARRQQQAGDHTASVRLLGRFIEELATRRLDLILQRFMQERPFPDRGLRLMRTETGVQVVPLREDYCAEDSNAYLGFAAHLCSSLPDRGTAEWLSLLLQGLSRSCLLSRLKLSRKRRLLALLHRLRQPLLRRIAPVRDQSEALQAWLGAFFHEPAHLTRQLLRRHHFYFEYNYAKRLLHSRAARIQEMYLQEFDWPEEAAYRELVASCTRSRVLVSIHMGDFIGAFNRIARLAPDERVIISLSREQQTPGQLLSRSELRHSVMQHGTYNPLKIVSELRAGNRTLSALFDLREQFGATVPVTFFGRPARLVKGPAELAIMGKAQLLPFVTYERDGRNVIEMEALIESTPLAGESIAEASERITRQLARLAEKWIARDPAQWKYLSSLFSYFNTGKAAAGAG